jgi:flagellar capping protein FliD
MTFDSSTITAVLALCISSLNLIGLVRSMLSAGEKKLDERQTKTEAKLIDHDRRIQSIEGELKHLPDRETTHRIELTMLQIIGRLDSQDATLTGKFAAMDERLKPIQAIGERLQDVLVEQAKKLGNAA